METQTRFTDLEIDILRFLAARYRASDPYVMLSDVPRLARVPIDRQVALMDRFQGLQLVRQISDGEFETLAAVLDVVHQLDHPPPINYWTAMIQWWFSARWRALVTVFGVVLPLIVQWIEMIRVVLGWLGVV